MTLAVAPDIRDSLLQAPTDTVRFLDVPPLTFLEVDGEGSPETSSFSEGVETLYPVAYTLRFALKRTQGIERRVGPLEGLWWSDVPGRFEATAPSTWRWRLMIALPEEATGEEVDAAISEVRAKKHPAGIDRLRVERFAEGPSAQIMHLGPYSTEGSTIERLHEAIKAAGKRLRGRHHEIYLGDPRRSAPERLRTILRQPIE